MSARQPATADPAAWGMTAQEARALLEQQMCPVCGAGPWATPLNHVSRAHGIRGPVMRDVCGLSSRDWITAPALREVNQQQGRERTEILRANAEQVKGARGRRKQRRTKAYLASLGANLARWEAENPEVAAQMRAGFRDRMTTPEAQARHREAMARMRAEYTPEERAAIAERLRGAPAYETAMAAHQAARAAAAAAKGCAVEGCPRRHRARGLCDTHWRIAHADRGSGSL